MPNPLFNQTTQTLNLRYYQQDGINAAYDYLRNRPGNPCIVLPTGAGKTPVMASICNDVVSNWNGRVLVLAHVKELLQQTAETIGGWFPKLDVGVYSAGLKKRDTKNDVLIAGVQSVYKKGLDLSGDRPFNIVLVDESHRIPTSGDGMYRKLLQDLTVASPSLRVIGLTATPYRLKGGYVCGPKHFLNEICYEVGVRELIAQEFLCPLTSKQAIHSTDPSKFGIRNGEYKKEDLAEAYDNEANIQSACQEIADATVNRTGVIIFCCSVEHAEHVTEAITALTGQECELITGDTPKDQRARTIDRFKNRQLKYLANVNVLTEGFDAKHVDCVALVRSTLSPGLYYQMVGRGLRVHPAKADCLVLDFGGNVEKHGCIDDLQIKTPSSSGSGDPMTKVCSECLELVPLGFDVCTNCGHAFPIRDTGPKHDGIAATTPITSDQVPIVKHPITEVTYTEHIKRGADENAPRTLRVTYYEGMNVIADEWICIEHTGFIWEKAAAWWTRRCAAEMPKTSAEAATLGLRGFIAEPTEIHIKRVPGKTFPDIVGYELEEIPDCSDLHQDAF